MFEMNCSLGSSNSKKFVVLIHLLITSCVVICGQQKNKYSFWNEDDNYESLKNLDDDVTSLDRSFCASGNSIEDCDDDRDNFMFNMQYNKRQTLHNALFPNSIGDKSIRTVPLFHSNQALSCSCELERKMIDLGILYYPRYLLTTECKPGGCHGGFRCHAKKYKIHVLKKKQIEDEDRLEKNLSGFPESLKDLYIPVPIHVTVACECAP